MKKATLPVLVTKITALANYLQYLRDFSKMVPGQIKKNELWLLRVEASLGHPILEAKTATEINRAIMTAAEDRRRAYNGGHDHEGQDLRFRLGQAVKCFVEWSVAENLIRRNHYPKNPFKRPPLRDAYYIPHEKVALLYNSPDLEPLDQAIIRFLIDTGVRISELCSVKREDLDMENMTASVFMSKVNRMKTVPFSATTKESLERVMSNHPRTAPVFWGRKGPIDPNGIRRRMQKLAKRFGFRMNPHAFRHSTGTMWVTEVSEIAAMKLLGHTSLKQTSHYTHLMKYDLTKYRQKVGKRFFQMALTTDNR